MRQRTDDDDEYIPMANVHLNGLSIYAWPMY